MAYSTITKPGLHFNTKLYTGNGSTNNITGVGFQPDWVWIKDRTNANAHRLSDAVRGVTKYLASNSSGAEATETAGLTAFDSDGFSLGSNSDFNGNSANLVAWNWKANGAGSSNSDGTITTTTSANSTSGFSIIKYTGTGSGGATIGHGLSKKPKAMIVKETSGSSNWVYWQDTTGNGTSDIRMHFNATNSNYNNYHVTFGTNTVTLPSTSNAKWSGSGSEYIAYCFADIPGYSKFGAYTGNGNANGTFIYTGFAPAFIMCKKYSSTGNWVIQDNKRDNSFNVHAADLNPNLSEAEESNGAVDFLSNGFKMRNTDQDNNYNGATYIYAAFAEEPLVANVGTNGIPNTAR